MAACPICKSASKRHPDNRWAPFCSERCKLVDLGNWLGGSYRFDDATPAAPPIPSERPSEPGGGRR